MSVGRHVLDNVEVIGGKKDEISKEFSIVDSFQISKFLPKSIKTFQNDLPFNNKIIPS
ncbi:unnamed protein product [Acanthoscelides obtectus]|uniref:Uncharacterized protein n=1 Tax=Acanthoscelides obtectus TaxID=200917 RepID=A0A9P0PQ29_ACAOB|nr:unnamed protein product [Acanthoscelides obtectus]CAK1642045.1 hypothetical protein AOBTE_LOCUS12812 [Acanthoscelides obtectus]